MCLGNFCLFGEETDYPLPLASLFTLFSESKKRQKIFSAQTSPRKRGYVEDFAHQNHLRLRNLKNSHFTLSTKLCCEIAARQARGYGVLYEVEHFRNKCYSLYNLTVNRTNFSDQLAYGKMTFTNISFMFGRIKLQVRSKTYQNVPYRTKLHSQRRDTAENNIMSTMLHLETSPIEQCEASASDFASQLQGQCKTRIFELSEAQFVVVGEILLVAALSLRRLSGENLLRLFRFRKVGE